LDPVERLLADYLSKITWAGGLRQSSLSLPPGGRTDLNIGTAAIAANSLFVAPIAQE